jgi:hypothetical protein
MTTHGHGALTPIVGHLQQQLADRDPLLVSSALAHGPLDFVADALSGARHLRFMPWRDPGFDEAAPADHHDDVTAATRVVLGAEDLDLVAHRAPLTQAAQGGPATAWCKQRQLDGLFGAVAPAAGAVGALFIGEPATRVLAVLEGAAGLLTMRRTSIVLPLEECAASAAAAALLRRTGHALYDQWLHPLPEGGPLPATWVLAVAGECVVKAPPQPPSRRLSWTIPIDEPLARSGFYPVEGAAPATWCWIGPRPRAGLLLPTWPGRLLQVGLQLRAVGDGVNIAATVARLDGVPAAVRMDGPLLWIESPASAAPRAFRRLDLTFPTSSRDESGRRLVVAAIAAVQLDFATE